MKVLVTGGSGFVGRALKKIKPEWHYISSRDYDLTSAYEARGAIRDHRNLDAIVHLAGRVGGVKENTDKQAEFIYQNLMINTNIINEAYREGVPRVLSALSTCAYPENLSSYPFDESKLHQGPPPVSNMSYGYAKRCLHVMSNAYSDQYGVKYTTFTPSNLYGPEDNFDLNSSHFVAAMIKKIYNSEHGQQLEFWGSGRPLRQQLYITDMAKLVPILLEKHLTNEPIIVSPNENLTIEEMIKMCLKISSKDVQYRFNGEYEGQYRKDGSNKKLFNLIGQFEFTPFEQGLRETYEWYKNTS
jgi:GDP-L-fucose synthase